MAVDLRKRSLPRIQPLSARAERYPAERRCRPLQTTGPVSFLGLAAQTAVQDRVRPCTEDGRHVDLGIADEGVSLACLLPERSRLSKQPAGVGRLRPHRITLLTECRAAVAAPRRLGHRDGARPDS